MRKRLRSINPGVCAKVFVVLYLIIGIITGVMFALAKLFSDHPVQAIGAAIMLPAGYALAGFIGGYVGAVLYNFVAKITGGIEFELDDPLVAAQDDLPYGLHKPH